MKARARQKAKTGSGGKSRRGFTLVELVIVIVVMGIVIVAITPFLRVNLASYIAVQSGKRNMDMARIGFNRMITELKRIQNPNTIEGVLSPTSITFTGTFYKSGNWYSRNLNLTWDSNAQTVTRDDIDRLSGPIILVNNVTAFQIEYFDRDNAVAATATDVWRIRLSMTAGTGSDAMTFVQEIHPKIFAYIRI